MTSEKDDLEKQHYPWARVLMIVVLYGALLFFLWHFPSQGGRVFFQNLFKGFLYLLAGLALIGVTILAFTFIPVPLSWAIPRLDDAFDDEDEYEEYEDVDGGVSDIFTGRALMIPTLKSVEGETEVWDILRYLEEDFQPDCIISLDPDTGILMVSEEDPDEADFLINEIRARLRQAKISARTPR